jgi:hypothetical protein
MQKISALQYRFSSPSKPASTESWKQIASGNCY